MSVEEIHKKASLHELNYRRAKFVWCQFDDLYFMWRNGKLIYALKFILNVGAPTEEYAKSLMKNYQPPKRVRRKRTVEL